MSKWRPKLQISIAEDTIEEVRQKKQFEFDYKGELDEFIRRSTQYNDNLCKAYALLRERCTKTMQHKIASQKDFKSKIFNNLILLLKVIKEHSLNYLETRYKMSIITDVLRVFLIAKQKEKEKLKLKKK